jgi:hypothetical protein
MHRIIFLNNINIKVDQYHWEAILKTFTNHSRDLRRSSITKLLEISPKEVRVITASCCSSSQVTAQGFARIVTSQLHPPIYPHQVKIAVERRTFEEIRINSNILLWTVKHRFKPKRIQMQQKAAFLFFRLKTLTQT